MLVFGIGPFEKITLNIGHFEILTIGISFEILTFTDIGFFYIIIEW